MNIYVSNLGHRITTESLTAAFATYGAVRSSQIIMDGFTGNPRGFGFVDMPNENEATTAILRINGCVIDGQIISAAEAGPLAAYNGSLPIDSIAKK